MNQYLAILSDKNTFDPDMPLVVGHVDHLKKLDAEGILFMCAPFKGVPGAMQILNAETLEEATEIVMKDPFLTEKFYQSVTIYDLIECNANNNFLLK